MAGLAVFCNLTERGLEFIDVFGSGFHSAVGVGFEFLDRLFKAGTVASDFRAGLGLMTGFCAIGEFVEEVL